MVQNSEVWICLAHVFSDPKADSPLETGKKAYVIVLGYALNAFDLEIKIKNALNDMGLTLLSIEDEEPYSVRISEWEVSEETLEKAKEAEQNKGIRFTTFHTYSE